MITSTMSHVDKVATGHEFEECPFVSLPLELFSEIFGHCDIRTLGKLPLVSKQWDVLSSHDDVWVKFKEVYELKSPKFKDQRKLVSSLFPIYQKIKAIIEERNQDFYCKLSKKLFLGNILSIEIKPKNNDDPDPHFEIILSKWREIIFSSGKITSICLPKKVHLIVSEIGFQFENSLQVNNYQYQEIFGGTLSLSFTGYYTPAIYTTTGFLDSIVSVKDF